MPSSATSNYLKIPAPIKAPTTPAAEANYLVLARFRNKAVTRLLSLPPSLRFSHLHIVMQIAFGWTPGKDHSFDIFTTHKTPDGCLPCARMRLVNKNNRTEFDALLEYEATDEVVADQRYSLRDIYEMPELKGKARIVYTYDSNNDWQHDFALIGRACPDMCAQMGQPEGPYVSCLGGEGVLNMKELESMSDSADSEERAASRKVKKPSKWDRLAVNDKLADVLETVTKTCPRKRRRAGDSLRSLTRINGE